MNYIGHYIYNILYSKIQTIGMDQSMSVTQIINNIVISMLWIKPMSVIPLMSRSVHSIYQYAMDYIANVCSTLSQGDPGETGEVGDNGLHGQDVSLLHTPPLLSTSVHYIQTYTHTCVCTCTCTFNLSYRVHITPLPREKPVLMEDLVSQEDW